MNQVINIPEGFELKKVSETEYKIVPKERKLPKLPKTWEEFCEMKNITSKECFINSCCLIENVDITNSIVQRAYDSDRNLCPSKEVAEGILALMQLIQLRDYYNDGWKKDDNIFEDCYVITCYLKRWLIGSPTDDKDYLFTFKSYKLAEEFLNNFKDLFDKVTYLF